MTNAEAVNRQVRAAIDADPRTLDQIAAAAGIQPVNVRQFRTGSRALPVGLLAKLAEALGYELELSLRPRKAAGRRAADANSRPG